MTKLKWDRQDWNSTLNSEYWNNPKTGFDKDWHETQKHKQAQLEKEKQSLGIHINHTLEKIQVTSGPHSGKLVCKTCNNKFIKWLPKKAF